MRIAGSLPDEQNEVSLGNKIELKAPSDYDTG